MLISNVNHVLVFVVNFKSAESAQSLLSQSAPAAFNV